MEAFMNYNKTTFLNFYLNRNNVVSDQFVGNQFPIIPPHLIIHTFLPESLRKTGSHPKPREHILRNCTTINGFTVFSAVIFHSTNRSIASTTL